MQLSWPMAPKNASGGALGLSLVHLTPCSLAIVRVESYDSGMMHLKYLCAGGGRGLLALCIII